jgi:hypothetical protein
MNQILRFLGIIVLFFVLSNVSFSQGVAINTDGSNADNSAMLDVSSNNKGMLVPRVSIADLNTAAPISSPAISLLVYNTNGTTGAGYYYWDGSKWTRLTIADDLDYVDGNGVATRIAFWSGANTLTSDANLYWDDANNRLGIRTSSPTTPLYLDASAHNGTAMIVDRYASGGVASIQAGPSNEYLMLEGQGTTGKVGVNFYSSGDVSLANGGGNVGVGTNSATAQLHTTGTVRLANYTNGFLQVDGIGNLSVGTGSDLFTAGDGLSWSGTTLNSLWRENGTSIYNGNSGNVGVGTSSPGEKLEVAGTFEVDHASSGALAYLKGGSDDTSYEWVGFYSGETRQGIMLWDGPWSGAGNRSNEFSITAENGNWLTLTSSTGTSILGGNVGVGTTSPAEKLHVNGSVRGNQSGALRISTGSGYVDIGPKNTGWSHFYTDRTRYWFNTGLTVETGNIGSYNENLSLQTSGTTRMTILTSNGNVGIGTTSPATKLQVNGSVYLPSGNSYWIGNHTDSGDRLRLHLSGTNSYVDYASGTLYFRAGTATKVVFTSAGLVGIGTTSPGAQLDVVASSTQSYSIKGNIASSTQTPHAAVYGYDDNSSGHHGYLGYYGTLYQGGTSNRSVAVYGKGNYYGGVFITDYGSPYVGVLGVDEYGDHVGVMGISKSGDWSAYYSCSLDAGVYGRCVGTGEGVYGLTDDSDGAGAYGEAPGYCEVEWGWTDDYYATDGSAGVFGKGTETEGSGGTYDDKGGLGVMGDGTAIGGWFDGSWDDYMKSGELVSLMTNKRIGLGVLARGNTSILAKGNSFGIVSQADGVALVTQSESKLSAYHLGNVVTEAGYAQILKPDSENASLAYSVVAKEKQIIISGSASFKRGRSVVSFDSDLSGLIEDASSIFVNITPTGFTSGNYAVVRKSQAGFEVALRGGEDITYDYMVVVKVADNKAVDEDILDAQVRGRIHQKANFTVTKNEDVVPAQDENKNESLNTSHDNSVQTR